MSKFLFADDFRKLNFQNPTPIQEAFFRKVKPGVNLIGVSKTGTGKTLAYLLPVINYLDVDLPEIQVLIIVPTNELVFQINSMLNTINDKLKVRLIYGGINKEREKQKILNNAPNIIISTPKQLALLLEDHQINLAKLKFVIFDEADMLFDLDFLSTIDEIMPKIKNCTHLLLSATITQAMKPFLKEYFKAYEMVDVTEKTTLKIKYHLIKYQCDNKDKEFFSLLNKIKPFLALIFVSKKETQSILYHKMQAGGFQVLNYNSALKSKLRLKLIKQIQNHEFQYIIVTDLIARGIDLVCDVVINYDLPNNHEYFFHRSGRTGRMNNSGDVYVFANAIDQKKINNYQKKGIEFIGVQKEKKVDPLLIKATKNIRKPKKVTPGYKKKNKAKIKKNYKELKKNEYTPWVSHKK